LVLNAHIIRRLLLVFFGISAGSAFLRGQASSGDCLGAIPVCASFYDVPVLSVPPDNVPNEINAAISCLSNGEDNGVWYTFTVQSSGILHFNIIPYDPTDDYDWALFDLTSANCTDIATNASLEVACNFSSSVLSSGVTGANGGANPQDEPTVPVVAGQRFVLYISNFSQSTNGYQLDFNQSTAQIPDNVPPVLLSAVPNAPCGAARLTLTFSENIDCSSVAVTDFTITGPGGPYTVTNVFSPDCSAGAAYADQYLLVFTPAMNTGGNFTVQVTGSISDICGNNAANNLSVNFNYSALSLDSAVFDASCGVNDGQATVLPSGGTAPYTYLWSDPAAQTTQTATNLARGTYTVTVTDNFGCHSTLTVIVSDPTSFTFTVNQSADTCSKGVGVLTVNVNGTTAPYTYNWDNTATNGNSVFTGAVGDSAFYIRVTDALGCWLDTTIIVDNILNDSLEAYFVVDDDEVDFLYPYVTFYSQSLYYTSLLWDLPGNNTGTQSQFTYSFENDTLGDYPISLIATDANGCRDTFTLIVTLYAEFAMYVPDAFTVNDDNLNETFEISGIGINKNTFEMRIYDRFGHCVYESRDITQGWDGRVNGRSPTDSEMGVYVYKINVKDIYGNPHERIGRVVMIK